MKTHCLDTPGHANASAADFGRILASQTPPKTLPKSAALLAVPRRVRPICFNIQDLIDLSTYRGGPGTLNPQFSHLVGDHVGAMLALFCALGRSQALLGRFLGTLAASCRVCCRSWLVFVRLGPLWARSWRVLEAPEPYFLQFLRNCEHSLRQSS